MIDKYNRKFFISLFHSMKFKAKPKPDKRNYHITHVPPHENISTEASTFSGVCLLEVQSKVVVKCFSTESMTALRRHIELQALLIENRKFIFPEVSLKKIRRYSLNPLQ